jgi:hypothetical protein
MIEFPGLRDRDKLGPENRWNEHLLWSPWYEYSCLFRINTTNHFSWIIIIFHAIMNRTIKREFKKMAIYNQNSQDITVFHSFPILEERNSLAGYLALISVHDLKVHVPN